MILKTNVELKTKPFDVPNYVIIDESMDAGMNAEQPAKLPLSAFSSEDLMSMVYEFERAVFKKAGKQPPPRAA